MKDLIRMFKSSIVSDSVHVNILRVTLELQWQLLQVRERGQSTDIYEVLTFTTGRTIDQNFTYLL